MNIVEKLELEIERKKHKEEIKKLEQKIERLDIENQLLKRLFNNDTI